MGRAETVTLLPIDRYYEIMSGRLSCHFNQVNGAKVPPVSGCDDIWSQADREDLAWTIFQAEQMIAHEAGFWPAPKYITNEEIFISGPTWGNCGYQNSRSIRRSTRVRSDWWDAEFETQYKYVQAFGTEQLTLIQSGAPVVYANQIPDYYDREETALIGDPGTLYSFIETTCTNPCNVAVFFREEDGAWDTADPRWEIRPLKVDIDNGNLYITGESCMFVQPSLWELDEYSNPDDAWKIDFELTNLVDWVDIYCRTTYQGTPITLNWEGVCDCGAPCGHSQQGACAYVTDFGRGYFAPRAATWNGSAHVYATPTYSRAPVKMTVNYLAGYPLDSRTCRMDPKLEAAVVALTNALLPEPPCGFCDPADTRWKRDREPVDPLTPEAASMPWDIYSKGALRAWRIIKMMARGRGGSIRG